MESQPRGVGRTRTASSGHAVALHEQLPTRAPPLGDEDVDELRERGRASNMSACM
jgi:hypothetical protein